MIRYYAVSCAVIHRSSSIWSVAVPSARKKPSSTQSTRRHSPYIRNRLFFSNDESMDENWKTLYHGYLNGYFPAFSCSITHSKGNNTQVPMVLPIQVRDRACDIGPWNIEKQTLQPTLISRYNVGTILYQYNHRGHCRT